MPRCPGCGSEAARLYECGHTDGLCRECYQDLHFEMTQP